MGCQTDTALSATPTVSKRNPQVEDDEDESGQGCMTGKGKEIVDVMERRRIDVMSVQEVR